MNARRAAAAVALALIAGGALMAAGTALPLPPVGDPGRLGSWWTDRGPAVAAFSAMRLGGLIGAGYLALVGSVALLGALTRWRWTVSLSKLAARPGLMRLLIGGSLVAALSTPAEAAARPGPLLTVTDTGPAAAPPGPDPGGAALTIADLGPDPGGAALTIADLGPDPGGAALTAADLGPDPGGAALTAADPGPMRSRPAPAGAGLIVADIGPSRAPAPTTAEAGAHHPGAEMWTVEAGDHLWAIAAETVADRTGRADDESVRSYWERLIEANRHIVGDDPDLIHPGQVLELPE